MAYINRNDIKSLALYKNRKLGKLEGLQSYYTCLEVTSCASIFLGAGNLANYDHLNTPSALVSLALVVAGLVGIAVSAKKAISNKRERKTLEDEVRKLNKQLIL